nr:MAG TPA: hypothetical protein [Caudoviricetes sp.]
MFFWLEEHLYYYSVKSAYFWHFVHSLSVCAYIIIY